MKRHAMLLVTFAVVIAAARMASAQTGPYVSKIKQLQVTNVGSPYNTVFLEIDVTNSPCGSTNSNDRFTVTNEAQLSVILAAVMVDRQITITGTGSCNGAGVEDINSVVLKP